MTEYHLDLTKSTGIWTLKTVSSNDWFEKSKGGKPFDVARELAEMTVQRPEKDRVVSMPAPEQINRD